MSGALLTLLRTIDPTDLSLRTIVPILGCAANIARRQVSSQSVFVVEAPSTVHRVDDARGFFGASLAVRGMQRNPPDAIFSQGGVRNRFDSADSDLL